MFSQTELALGDAGVLVPGPWLWLRALTWMAAMLAVLTFVLSWQAIVRRLGGDQPLLLQTVSIASVIGAYSAYYAMVRFGERRTVSELSPSAIPTDMALGLTLGAAMFALVFAGLRLLGVYSVAWGNWYDWGHDIRQALTSGLLEELVARLVIFRLLMRAFGTWPALVLAALLFGMAHLINPHSSLFAGLAIAVEAGLMLAAFYMLTGRIWVSVGVHAAWNFTQGAVFGAHVSGTNTDGSLLSSMPVPEASTILSGGSFGPEASLPAVIVGIVVSTLVIVAAQRRRTV